MLGNSILVWKKVRWAIFLSPKAHIVTELVRGLVSDPDLYL